VSKVKISAEKRRMLEGYVFVLPFILGMLFFFVFPFFVSIKLSFGDLVKMTGFHIKWLGFDNYVRAFLVDVEFIPMFLEAVSGTLMKTPLIIIFSLLIAMMINTRIKFRGFFRTVFFIPFLLGMGDVMRQLLSQGVDKQVVSLSGGKFVPITLLNYMGPNVVSLIDSVFGIIVVVLWGCGVQILLFLSGLQTISESHYESAKVDGATGWEMFWKITLPMISPIMLLNIIYTLVDNFTNITNPILQYIQDYAFRSMEFEYAAAIGWIYFLFIILLVALVIVIMNNMVHVSDMKGVNGNGKKQ
jgi:ABC-type sugar transport system permease subunit